MPWLDSTAPRLRLLVEATADAPVPPLLSRTTATATSYLSDVFLSPSARSGSNIEITGGNLFSDGVMM
ncbi:hypothetical protein PQX77_012314 [Marasmius sp. AFHP31]|nr:hypothetical protein PQX77_012314 [Marasmius sp. AFHP31]